MPVSVQAKLAVGAPDDGFEREADAVAERVMRMSDPSLREGGAAGLAGEVCAACGGREDGLRLLPKGPGGYSAGEAPPSVWATLACAGRPLDPASRRFFEPRFGRDLSAVRIHADRSAAVSAQAVKAQAYTVGPHIAFAAGRYAPETEPGRRLLAHELTHTVQQGAGSADTLRRMAACPARLVPGSPTPAGWQDYHYGTGWFHCGFRGILENRAPTPNDPQNECFYDGSGRLVDEHHPYAGCRGTPNWFDSASHPAEHAVLDPGGIRAAGLPAFATSVDYAIRRPVSAAVDSAARSAARWVRGQLPPVYFYGIPIRFKPEGSPGPVTQDRAERRADAVAQQITRMPAPGLRREAAPAATPAADPLIAPLTEAEWRGVDRWLSLGEVGVDPLTGDAERNADLVAGAIFCNRLVFSPQFGAGDPLLCLEDEVTRADPRVQALRRQVVSRGPIVHWPAVPIESRVLHAMDRLIRVHGFPPNAAAGIVGNLRAESRVLPSMVQGGSEAAPMTVPVGGRRTAVSPEEVRGTGVRPAVAMPLGVGLAQWTVSPRRPGLFQRVSATGRPLGASILFDMDAQIDYFVSEIRANAGLNRRLTAAAVSPEDASDAILFALENPAAILEPRRPDGAPRRHRPRSDPEVQRVMNERRGYARAALATYRGRPGAGAREGGPR